MKKQYFIIVITLASLIFNSCSSGYKSPEDLGEKMLECVIDNDYDSFKELFCTHDEFISYVKDYYTGTFYNKFSDDDLYNYHNFDERLDRVNILYQKIREKGSSMNIDWANVKILNMESKRVSDNAYKAYDVYIDVELFGKEYYLLLDDCIYTKNGWKSLFGRNDVQFVHGKYRRH